MPIERRRVLYISPEDDALTALLDACRAATASLHILCYGFTLEALAEVALAHHRAGLAVGVVADKEQSAGPTQRALLRRLVDAGVPVTITTSTVGGAIMHEKVALVDVALGAEHNASLAVYGSFNFSGRYDEPARPGRRPRAHTGAQLQANHLQVDNDPSVVALFWRQYREMEAFGKAHPHWQLIPTEGAADAPSA